MVVNLLTEVVGKMPLIPFVTSAVKLAQHPTEMQGFSVGAPSEKTNRKSRFLDGRRSTRNGKRKTTRTLSRQAKKKDPGRPGVRCSSFLPWRLGGSPLRRHFFSKRPICVSW